MCVKALGEVVTKLSTTIIRDKPLNTTLNTTITTDHPGLQRHPPQTPVERVYLERHPRWFEDATYLGQERPIVGLAMLRR